MKKDKKKVNSAAAAAATVIAGAAAVTMGTTGVENDSNNDAEDSVSNEPDVAEPQDLMVDGGTLPEVEITGEAPMVDGGVLADVVVSGHAAEPSPAVEPEEPVADVAAAEPVAPVDAEPEAIAPTEHIAAATPVTDVVAEPDFGEEFDEEGGDLAIAEATPGTIAEELLHKAEEKLSDLFVGGAHTDEQDFVNTGDASDFMYQE